MNAILNIGIEETFNECYIPYLNAKHAVQIFFGGSSSGKSVFLAQRTVLDVLKGNNYLVCKYDKESIKTSIYNEIVSAIKSFGLEDYFEIPKSQMVITCKTNNKQILFKGLKDVERVKSVKPIDGIISKILVEEATDIEDIDTFRQLLLRLRGPKSKGIDLSLILIFNPIHKGHCIYTEWFSGIWDDSMDKYESGDDLLIVKFTYKDNKFLGYRGIKNIEDVSAKSKNQKRVYAEGKWGVLGEVIFDNYIIADILPLVKNLKGVVCGVDWGWKDPNAFIKTYFDVERKRIYCWSEIYHSRLKVNDFARLIKDYGYDNELIICDVNNGEAIEDFKETWGLNIQKAIKKEGSIKLGIKWMQECLIIVDNRCEQLINEFSSYHWKKNKDGTYSYIPEGADHLIDCIRMICNTVYRELSA